MSNQGPPSSVDVPEGAPFRLLEDGSRLECWCRKRPKGLLRASWQVGLLLLFTMILTWQFIHGPTLGSGAAMFFFWCATFVVAFLWQGVNFRDAHLVLDESGLTLDIKVLIGRSVKLVIPLSQVHRFEVSEWRQTPKKTIYSVHIRLLEAEIPFAYDMAQADGEWLAARLNEHLAPLLAHASEEALNPWKGL